MTLIPDDDIPEQIRRAERDMRAGAFLLSTAAIQHWQHMDPDVYREVAGLVSATHALLLHLHKERAA